MKNRLEEEIKSRFDSFEPEVDPGLWERISSGLENPSSGDAHVQGQPTGTLQTLLKATWMKWGVAALLTGSIMAGGILYLKSTVEPEVRPMEDNVQLPADEKKETNVETDAEGRKVSTEHTSGHPDAPRKTEEALNLDEDHQSDGVVPPGPVTQPLPQATVPSASTRIFNGIETGKTNEESPKTDAGHHSAPEEGKTAQPVLIISSKRGFAPFTVTVMTTRVQQTAEYAFGDGTVISRKGSATHAYDRPGTYRVSCTTGEVTLEETIEVIGEIPTAFSPNGDGINDVFIIDNPAEATLDLRIFDRSGRLVFNRKGTVIEWNGTLKNGENADAGTYLYDIFATPEGGISWKQKGTIHIFK